MALRAEFVCNFLPERTCLSNSRRLIITDAAAAAAATPPSSRCDEKQLRVR